jgi:DNA processing protein
VSHFLMGTVCSPGNFPARNALIVGLSQATIVVEAPKRSGALITADLTLRVKRPLFAVPGNADSPTSEGTNALMGKGALPASRFEDIVRRLGGPIPKGPQDSRREPPRPLVRALPPGLGGQILGALENGPQQIETLCARLGTTAATLLTELTLLEMDGYIRQRPGKFFEKA